MSVQISPSLSPFAMYYKSESRLLTDTGEGVFLVVAEQVTTRNIVGEQVLFCGTVHLVITPSPVTKKISQLAAKILLIQ